MRYPSWITELKPKERLRAKAIYVFLFLHRNPSANAKVQQEFECLVELADWPKDGTLPGISFNTSKKLGIDLEEWDEWKRFSKLRGITRKIRKQLILSKKLL